MSLAHLIKKQSSVGMQLWDCPEDLFLHQILISIEGDIYIVFISKGFDLIECHIWNG